MGESEPFYYRGESAERDEARPGLRQLHIDWVWPGQAPQAPGTSDLHNFVLLRRSLRSLRPRWLSLKYESFELRNIKWTLYFPSHLYFLHTPHHCLLPMYF